MLTGLSVRNFKRLTEVEVELGQTVVFIGPNNSGKTTALQALGLWNVGLKRWNEKRSGRDTPEKRPGVTINRRDLVALPVPTSNHLWRDLHVRDVQKVDGKTQTQNVRIDITVSGVSLDGEWRCGFEFDYANEESLYCRPLRLSNERSPRRMPVPDAASETNVVFLPAMSGLAAQETRLDAGAINVRIGEGRTAEVLRNLCFHVYNDSGGHDWQSLLNHMRRFFGIQLDPPEYIAERGEIRMTYRERSGAQLDLSSAGRGLQQILLLLAQIYRSPKTVLLLDEPDAHLEILRQREMYQLLTDVAAKQGCQIIAASHSEVILNEAADRDVVVAFVGKPHRIDDRGTQLKKALKEIGFEEYYQAEVTGWALYLEGSTDLAILRALARTLNHPAATTLDRPLVHYVANQPAKARDHFYGIREAKHDLVGIAIFDRLDVPLQIDKPLREVMWKQRELENYVATQHALLAFAEANASGVMAGPLFETAERDRLRRAMTDSIAEVTSALATLGRPAPFSADIKASDDFLDPVFAKFFAKIGLPNLMRKSDYHTLAQFVEPDEVPAEVRNVLDAIVEVARTARPVGDGHTSG
jgi:ABC-type hemin transport system ATPase subunit